MVACKIASPLRHVWTYIVSGENLLVASRGQNEVPQKPNPPNLLIYKVPWKEDYTADRGLGNQ